jgi:hypothetical protein
MWVEPLHLFSVCCSLDSIPLIPVVTMACGSKESESCVFTHLLVVMLYPCMLVPCRPRCLLGSCNDNRTAKNPGDVSMHFVHLGHGTLQVVWTLVFCCVRSFLRCPVSCHGVCIGRGRPPLFSSPLFHPLLVLVKL